jgi:two-component system cell cycle sensor histidine kinase/response regulator CckA
MTFASRSTPRPPGDFTGSPVRKLLPYLGAAGITGIAVMVRVLLVPRLGVELPFITLFPAVFVVAYLFGLGPAVLATVLSLVAALELFMGPTSSVSLDSSVVQLGAALFGLTGCGIGWLSELRIRAQRLADHAVERARTEAERADEETIRAEEEAARAEEETMRAEEETLRASREAQRAAQESERIERILASITDAFLVVDRRWVIRYVNEAAATLSGGRPSDLVGRPLWLAFPQTEQGPFGAMYRRAMAGQQVTRVQAYSAPLEKWLQVSAYPSAEGLSIVAQDVTDRVRAHEASERLAAIVASSDDAIVGKSLDGTVTSWNAAAERIFGYSAEEMVGRSIYTLIPPELHDLERDVLRRVARGEPGQFTEAERITRDGRRIVIALTVSPIRDATGQVVGASSVKRDITEEKRVQAALAAETARRRDLDQALDVAQAFVRDLDDCIVHWTGGAARLYGWSSAEAIGRVSHELLQTELPTPLEGIREVLLKEGRWEGALTQVAKDGHRLYVSSQWVLRRDPGGEPRTILQVDADETARRQIEERVRQNERLEVIGQLAGGVAHEANNQMTVVLGAAEFLLRRPELSQIARQDIEHIRAAAERTAAITGQLLAFSRRQVLQLRVVDIDETVQGLEGVLRRALGERSVLALKLNAPAGMVKADSGQLAQVLLNFVLNSRDAMPMGGRVTIETALAELTEGYARQHPGVAVLPGRYAMLAVSDTGHGMSRETAARAFEPFYTTKPVGKGTGLGLATVYGIVKQSNGYVWAYSEPGQGTTFKVYLPLATEAAPAQPALASPPRASGEMVLLVEDEPAVRQMASRALREYGYRVVEASRGSEALEILGRDDGNIRLLLTDVVMPEMDGPELARLASVQRPGLAVLFMSGYTDDEITRRGLLEKEQPFLQKPFTPESLSEQIERLLRERRGAEHSAEH